MMTMRRRVGLVTIPLLCFSGAITAALVAGYFVISVQTGVYI